MRLLRFAFGCALMPVILLIAAALMLRDLWRRG